jgi:GDPmannose 4,6-dehydratase
VSDGVARIKLGLSDHLALGNLDACRDWGFAGDYVRAMWLMLQQEQPDDYVIATGEAHTVEELVSAAFAVVGLDWRDHVDKDESLGRGSTDAPVLRGDATRARERLGWRPEVGFDELVRLMVEADLSKLRVHTQA